MHSKEVLPSFVASLLSKHASFPGFSLRNLQTPFFPSRGIGNSSLKCMQNPFSSFRPPCNLNGRGLKSFPYEISFSDLKRFGKTLEGFGLIKFSEREREAENLD
jgi:hypothetical protein